MSKTTIPTGGIADDAISEEHIDATVITGSTALAATPADTDELLISDAGTIKRIDYSYIKGQTNTPYFGAKLTSDQNINHNTSTKISFATEVFDSASAYDHSSNYRFTPQTAGKYLITASIQFYHSGTVLDDVRAMIYKNGSQVHQHSFGNYGNEFSYGTMQTTAIIDFNGSSDYVEAYGHSLTSDSGTTAISEGTATFFQGFFIAT